MAARGAYMITTTPAKQMSAPVMSYRSGRNPSTTIPLPETGDEDSAVGGEDPPEVRIGLEGCDETLGGQGDDAACDPEDAAVLSQALPDQPGPADLGEHGNNEQKQRTGHGHVGYRSSFGSAVGVRVGHVPQVQLAPSPQLVVCCRLPNHHQAAAASEANAREMPGIHEPSVAQPTPESTPATTSPGRTQQAAQARPAKPSNPVESLRRARSPRPGICASQSLIG